MRGAHGPIARSDMNDFVTTRWSLILEAQGEPTLDGQPALAELCELYWYPLYAYLRRRGHHREEAEDLTQGYFAYLLEHHSLDHVDQARGRFRSFLLASLNHYVANDRDWHRAQKRGGVISHVSLNQDAADARYRAEPTDGWTPEKAFDRNWALTLLEHALVRVRWRCEADGKGDLFEQLKRSLTGEPLDASYRQISETLGMTEAAVKQAAFRLRVAFREQVYADIASTVATADDVEAEFAYLISALT